MNRRTFLKALGLAPIAPAALAALPKPEKAVATLTLSGNKTITQPTNTYKNGDEWEVVWYTGTGEAPESPIIKTSFKPEFIMIKRAR